MKRERSIELLNAAVADELQAIHQYMYFHFHLDDQGLGPLAGLLRRVAIEEMGHAEQLAERILFLKGDVEMVPAGEVEKITDPQKILSKAAQMEEQAIEMYNKSAMECAANADSATRQIFEALVADEERHYDEFDQQLENIERFGPSYLALQSFGGPSEGGEPGGP
jgi:bacterioferritin